jgi:hypothetical protein
MNRHDHEKYPVDSFTPRLFEAGMDVRQAIQAPDALVALVLLSAASSVCQRSVDVVLPVAGGLVRPTSLFTMFIGESGERRSAVDALISAPIYERDEHATKAHDEAVRAYRTRREIWSAAKRPILKRLKKTIADGLPIDQLEHELEEHNAKEPTRPRLRRMIRQDMTSTAVYEALAGDREGISFITDEGQMMFDSASMRNLGLYNKLWDGPRTLPLDRANDTNLSIHNPRVSINIMTHPVVVHRFIQKRGDVAHGSGTLARFLIAMPPSEKGNRMLRDLSPTLAGLEKFQERMRELLKEYDQISVSGKPALDPLKFDDNAISLWRRAADDVELELRPGGMCEEVGDVASKLMEMASRIAAIMHYFEGYDGDITEDTLRRGIDIAKWHLHEFHRVFVASISSPEELDADMLLRYLHKRYWRFGVHEVDSREVSHNCGLRPKIRLDSAVDVLCRRGDIYVVSDEKDKRKYKISHRHAFAQAS